MTVRVSMANKRWWLLVPLLCLAGWLAVFGDKTASGSAAAVSISARPSTSSSAISAATARTDKAWPEAIEELLSRQLWQSSTQPAEVNSALQRDLFSGRNWNPPPPAPAEIAPAVPTAPPLPFAFLGKKLEGEAWEVFLSRGEQNFVVREGQVFDGVYRVEKIAPPSLALTYLPLGQAQTLLIGEFR